jgi:hypothetical protein
MRRRFIDLQPRRTQWTRELPWRDLHCLPQASAADQDDARCSSRNSGDSPILLAAIGGLPNKSEQRVMRSTEGVESRPPLLRR